MISRLSGKFIAVQEQQALIEVSGVGYELMLANALAERLRQSMTEGDPITFETLYYIEAGDMKTTHYPRLVGFLDAIDREFFSLLTQVNGMGVKKTLKALVLPIRQVAVAIESKDITTLTRLPGVGARLAEKIVAELHGKTVKYALSRGDEPLAARVVSAIPMVDEALSVLVQLQYSRVEAERLVSTAIAQSPKIATVEELIQVIFRNEQQAVAEAG